MKNKFRKNDWVAVLFAITISICILYKIFGFLFYYMSDRPTTAPLLQSTAAKTIRNNYYENIHKIKSLSELKTMIKVIDEMCQCYKINPDFIFWTNEKFENSKLEYYVCF